MRIGICDDDRRIAEILAEDIRWIYRTDVVLIAFDKISSLLIYIEEETEKKLDILFMDIVFRKEWGRMQNGIKAAKKIQSIRPEIQIIFISGHSDYVQEIFQIEPVYFLLKPFNKEDVGAAMSRAVKRMEEKDRDFVKIYSGGKLHVILKRDIDYVESNKHRLRIWCGEMHYDIYRALKLFATELTGDFIQCHQSYLVNIRRIKKLDAWNLELFNEKQIPVSRSKYKQTRQALLEHTSSGIESENFNG